MVGLALFWLILVLWELHRLAEDIACINLGNHFNCLIRESLI